MARRKQLKGIAGNLGQWCLSRNFDCEGYWALGLLYAHAESVNSNKVVMNLLDRKMHPDSDKLGKVFKSISDFLARDNQASEIRINWLSKATVTFEFNSEYKHEYHHRGSGLGGKPSMCIVEITTDLGKTYTKKYGCNVWIHNPEREQRRCDY